MAQTKHPGVQIPGDVPIAFDQVNQRELLDDAPEIGGAYVPPYRIFSTLLTSAQLLALHTTPIQLVAAPASGLFLELCETKAVYNFVTTAYTIGSATNLTVNYTNASGAAATGTLSVTGLLDQTASTPATLRPVSGIVTAAAALVLCLAGANVTLGDGTLTVVTRYRIVNQLSEANSF